MTNRNKAYKGKGFTYCTQPVVPVRTFGAGFNPDRASAIIAHDKKWVSGTVLHYYFFDKESDGERVLLTNGKKKWLTWQGDEDQKNVVRKAFDTWKEVGVGLSFKEVDSRNNAEIRIGFMQGDGSWSYVGRDILGQARNRRTMNFGWDLTREGEIDTAIHEIGHTLGLVHEHQNGKAGIVWDEPAVLAELAGPPNFWPPEQTRHNILQKMDPDEVQGSSWDPDSIMHYPFGPGIIISPEEYKDGIFPKPGLSEKDKAWALQFYPPMEDEHKELKPFETARLDIPEGEQVNLAIRPETTRNYDFSTFGQSDTVMVLFEEENGELQYRKGDDDSGEDRNASFRVKLIEGHKYVLRVRLYYSFLAGETAVMMW